MLLFKSLVLPNLDYCSSVWFPHHKKDLLELEQVQRTFTRILYMKQNGVKNDEVISYANRCKLYATKPIVHRLIDTDLKLFRKILSLNSVLQLTEFFKLCRAAPRLANSLKVSIPVAKFPPFYHSFFVRVARWQVHLTSKTPAKTISDKVYNIVYSWTLLYFLSQIQEISNVRPRTRWCQANCSVNQLEQCFTKLPSINV